MKKSYSKSNYKKNLSRLITCFLLAICPLIIIGPPVYGSSDTYDLGYSYGCKDANFSDNNILRYPINMRLGYQEGYDFCSKP